MSLKEKVAIVTGGNSGIGKAIVLAEQGADVVIDYVCNPEAAEELERRCAAFGEKAIGVAADVSKVDAMRTLIDSEKIGSAVAFLAGDGASYVTATTIFADGGIMQSGPGL